MIKTQTVAVCDLCGAVKLAEPLATYRNETEWGVPKGWTTARGNDSMHVCGRCAQRLGWAVITRKGKEGQDDD